MFNPLNLLTKLIKSSNQRDIDKIQKIARLVFLTAWEVANKEERIVVDKDRN